MNSSTLGLLVQDAIQNTDGRENTEGNLIW